MLDEDAGRWVQALVVLGISALVSMTLFAQADPAGASLVYLASDALFQLFLALLLLRLPAPRRWIVRLPRRARGPALLLATFLVAFALGALSDVQPLLDPTTAFALVLLIVAGSFTASTLDGVARAVTPSPRIVARAPLLAPLLALALGGLVFLLTRRVPPTIGTDSIVFWILPPLHVASVLVLLVGVAGLVWTVRASAPTEAARATFRTTVFLFAFGAYLGIAFSSVETGRLEADRITAFAILTMVLKLLEPMFAVAERSVEGARLLPRSESGVFMLAAAFALLELYLAYQPAASTDAAPGRISTIIEALAIIGLLLGALVLPLRVWRARRRSATATAAPDAGKGSSPLPLLGLLLLAGTAIRTQGDARLGGFLLGVGAAASLLLAVAHASPLAPRLSAVPWKKRVALATLVLIGIAALLAAGLYVGDVDILDGPAWFGAGLLGGALVGEFLGWSAARFADATAAPEGSRSRVGAWMPLTLLAIFSLQTLAWLARLELALLLATLWALLVMLVASFAALARPTGGRALLKVTYWLAFAALLAASTWHFAARQTLPVPLLVAMAVAFIQMTTGDPAHLGSRRVLDDVGVRALQSGLTFAVVLTVTGSVRLGSDPSTAYGATAFATVVGALIGLSALPLTLAWMRRARASPTAPAARR